LASWIKFGVERLEAHGPPEWQEHSIRELLVVAGRNSSKLKLELEIG